jgi:hypothetical protein
MLPVLVRSEYAASLIRVLRDTIQVIPTQSREVPAPEAALTLVFSGDVLTVHR